MRSLSFSARARLYRPSFKCVGASLGASRAFGAKCDSSDKVASPGDAEASGASSEPRVYRQPENYVDFEFKWGVGNAFRAKNSNRFRPVHRPRPKVVSIPKDYFCSDTPAVRWESLNEAWEVAFVEDSGKRSSKPFPVKKFGVGRAKAEALAFAKLSEGKQRDLQRFQSSEPVDVLGFEQAKSAAESLARRTRIPLAS